MQRLLTDYTPRKLIKVPGVALGPYLSLSVHLLPPRLQPSDLLSVPQIRHAFHNSDLFHIILYAWNCLSLFSNLISSHPSSYYGIHVITPGMPSVVLGPQPGWASERALITSTRHFSTIAHNSTALNNYQAVTHLTSISPIGQTKWVLAQCWPV